MVPCLQLGTLHLNQIEDILELFPLPILFPLLMLQHRKENLVYLHYLPKSHLLTCSGEDFVTVTLTNIEMQVQNTVVGISAVQPHLQ